MIQLKAANDSRYILPVNNSSKYQTHKVRKLIDIFTYNLWSWQLEFLNGRFDNVFSCPPIYDLLNVYRWYSTSNAETTGELTRRIVMEQNLRRCHPVSKEIESSFPLPCSRNNPPLSKAIWVQTTLYYFLHNIPRDYHPVYSSGQLPSSFPTSNFFHILPLPTMNAACYTNLVSLFAVIIIVFGEKNNVRSS
jgi:hypothetical protein